MIYYQEVFHWVYKKMTINRGDIFYVHSNSETPIGGEIWSERPAVVVSNDAINKESETVIVAYTTTNTKRQSPASIEIKKPKKALVLCEQIYCVDKSRLYNYLGKVSKTELRQINKALAMAMCTSDTQHTALFKKWELYIKHNPEPTIDEYINQTDNQIIAMLIDKLKMTEDMANGYKSLYEAELKHSAYLEKYYNNKKLSE